MSEKHMSEQRPHPGMLAKLRPKQPAPPEATSRKPKRSKKESGYMQIYREIDLRRAPALQERIQEVHEVLGGITLSRGRPFLTSGDVRHVQLLPAGIFTKAYRDGDDPHLADNFQKRLPELLPATAAEDLTVTVGGLQHFTTNKGKRKDEHLIIMPLSAPELCAESDVIIDALRDMAHVSLFRNPTIPMRIVKFTAMDDVTFEQEIWSQLPQGQEPLEATLSPLQIVYRPGTKEGK